MDPENPVTTPDAMNIHQAANAIGGLNLFSDDGVGADDTGGTETPPAKTKGGKDLESQKDDANDDTDIDNDPAASDDDLDDDDDSEQSSDQNDSDTSDSDDESSETLNVSTVDELAEHLGLDADGLNQLEVSFKAAGEDVTVNFDELRRGYQRDADYRRRTQELADSRRDVESQKTQYEQHYQGELAKVGHVLQQSQQLLFGEMNNTEMQTLRATNPAEWAARREEMQTRVNQIQQLYQAASQQYDAFNSQQAEDRKKQLGELQRVEGDRLRTAIPDWSDDLSSKIVGYLGNSYGYSSDELNGVFDHRLITIANKARLYDAMQAAGVKTKEKFKVLPKVQKPAKGPAKPASKQRTKATQARQQARKSGKLRDAANAIGFLNID